MPCFYIYRQNFALRRIAAKMLTPQSVATLYPIPKLKEYQIAFNQLDKPQAGETVAIMKTNHGTMKLRLFEEFFFRIIEFVAKTIGVVIGFKWGLIGVAVGTTLMECVMKFVKVMYAGALISIPLHKTICILLKSCRFSFVMIPACLFEYYLVPEGITREITLLCTFCILSVVLFLFCPSFIGNDYKYDLYPTIKRYTLNIFKKILPINRK